MGSQTFSRTSPLVKTEGIPDALAASDRRLYYSLKRGADIAVSLVLLILLLPLMLVAALAIYIYSPGPIFFIQQRVGARRHTRGRSTTWETVNFPCYKFRTMKVNADSAVHQAYVTALIANNAQEMAAAKQRAAEALTLGSQPKRTTAPDAAAEPRKLTNDARVIRPGRILRKLSIDELPQLFNVLRGEMSMIGPRPAIPYEVEVYQPWHLLRLQAQPGISGLQQVTARCTADFDEQVRLDIEYIQRQSLWLDLKIALKTPLAIVFGRGAH